MIEIPENTVVKRQTIETFPRKNEQKTWVLRINSAK
jgi:hypothetical protein